MNCTQHVNITVWKHQLGTNSESVVFHRAAAHHAAVVRDQGMVSSFDLRVGLVLSLVSLCSALQPTQRAVLHRATLPQLAARVPFARLSNPELVKQLNTVRNLRPSTQSAEVQASLWEAAGLNPKYKVSGGITGEPSFTKLLSHSDWAKYTGRPPIRRWWRSAGASLQWHASAWDVLSLLCFWGALGPRAVARLAAVHACASPASRERIALARGQNSAPSSPRETSRLDHRATRAHRLSTLYAHTPPPLLPPRRTLVTWRYSTILRALWPISLTAAVWAFIVTSLPSRFLPRTSPVPLSLFGQALGLLLVFRTNNTYQRLAEASRREPPSCEALSCEAGPPSHSPLALASACRPQKLEHK